MIERIQKRIAFGYNRNALNRIEINIPQAMTVKLIFELYADGESRQSIAKILSYERYIGNTDYPQIIEKELFQRVQMVKERTAK